MVFAEKKIQISQKLSKVNLPGDSGKSEGCYQEYKDGNNGIGRNSEKQKDRGSRPYDNRGSDNWPDHLDKFLSELQALDFVVSEARKYKIRLILSLTNNWDAYGGKAQYVKWGEAGWTPDQWGHSRFKTVIASVDSASHHKNLTLALTSKGNA
ncbi:Mannan endo-1,4-beta-mannosidase 6 [Camellia lanceoleosa]|uniref:Mannan endo-1,4-beta-mannosidase 6 n=1 Tax=Camellia lanceoleosa TaxID=1840588 RepID=A0ACC0HGH9_9ERIC|nr:Mannan endo-1,4-beta-mannosidase 6 [Camellia lanceoleosa]